MTTIGVDGGGTHTRAALLAADGTVLGRGSAGPGNPIAAGIPAAAAALREAVAGALADHDPGGVTAGVAGVAGIGGLPAGAYDAAWRSLGLDCPLWPVPDAVVAFAAGSREPDGLVLIAGTGAVAVRIRAWAVAEVAGGLGWLLGDDGSGYWIGREALRRTALALQRRAGTGLAAALGGPATGADAFVAWAYTLTRQQVAALAPAVVAQAGDEDAGRIVRDAAACLTATLATLGAPDGPVVLSGGVLSPGSPVTRAVTAGIADRWGVEPALAGDGPAAAARLATVFAASGR